MKAKTIEILPSNNNYINLIDKLYWISNSKPPQSQKEAYYFCIDHVLNMLY